MRISDWSSDVCSSDLRKRFRRPFYWSRRLPSNDLHPLARPQHAVRRQRIDRQKSVQRIIGISHALGQGLDCVASLYSHDRSEEHTSELQSLMRISYAVFCLKKKNINTNNKTSVLMQSYVIKKQQKIETPQHNEVITINNIEHKKIL